jgi:hypothetical protein
MCWQPRGKGFDRKKRRGGGRREVEDERREAGRPKTAARTLLDPGVVVLPGVFWPTMPQYVLGTRRRDSSFNPQGILRPKARFPTSDEVLSPEKAVRGAAPKRRRPGWSG